MHFAFELQIYGFFPNYHAADIKKLCILMYVLISSSIGSKNGSRVNLKI